MKIYQTLNCTETEMIDQKMSNFIVRNRTKWSRQTETSAVNSMDFKTRVNIFKFLCVVVGLIFSSSAYAHLADAQVGFMSGLTHPIFGLDHLLAMLAVGIVSVQLGEKYVVTVPAVFVVLMIIGAGSGLAGYSVPYVEVGISLSVLLLGAAIAIVKSSKYSIVVMAFVAYFGFIHGYAHGAEMPAAIDPIFYFGGFATSTAVIHLLGVGIAHLFKIKESIYSMLRLVGVALTCSGAFLLFKVLN